MSDTVAGSQGSLLSFNRVAHFIHAKFIWLLMASYLVAGVLPAWGLAIKRLSFGELHVFHETIKVSTNGPFSVSLMRHACQD